MRCDLDTSYYYYYPDTAVDINIISSQMICDVLSEMPKHRVHLDVQWILLFAPTLFWVLYLNINETLTAFEAPRAASTSGSVEISTASVCVFPSEAAADSGL